MKTRKQIRHVYVMYLVMYIRMLDKRNFTQSDRWFLRAKTLARDVLERDARHDSIRLIDARNRQ